ncbi:MAG: carboxypeptidase regulatory-like domain-containing protein [Bacteroidales bacterium]|nr:carboxypeptidase regulatory-like domain-containing protein [Bacteroidales bacterium]
MKQTIKQFALTALSLFVAFAAIAQVTTSSMSGRITEADGTPVIGAAVVAVHTPSGSKYYSITDIAGNYRIQNMRVGGPYAVEVTYLGYGTIKAENMNLRLGENFVYNAQLVEEAMSLSEVVVSAGIVNPILNRDRTGASMNVSTREINSLPSISRSITDFTRMTPQANGNSFAGRDGRYNSINVDGAAMNNNFGLSSNSMPGGTAQPISLDVIEQISVNLAPYDVRLSQFTGASINAVTKSGDNRIKVSAYTYQRPTSFTGEKVGDLIVPKARESSNQTWGFTIGAPIIKDKLFIFASYEFEDESKPSGSWEPSTNGVADQAKRISRTSVADLERAKSHLLSTYNYDPGDYQNFGAFPSQNYKIFARLDWNIARNHKFSVRYNRLRNESRSLTNGTSGPPPSSSRSQISRVSDYSISFSNSFYTQHNSVDAFSAELNSTFGTKLSNKLLVSYTEVMDPMRSSTSAEFPFVDIYKDNNPYMSFGYELFTFRNKVLNNTLSIVNNLTLNLNKHTITFGAAYDNIFVYNSYVREGTSYYRFASLDDFINKAKPTLFGVTYGYGGKDPGAVEMDFGLASAYIQDEWQVNKNFKLTYGVRAELPMYHNEIMNNPAISALTFKDGYKIDVGTWPNTKMQINPRLGFNWDVKGDRSFQVRGGTGMFSGVLPFVWFTNQPTSSGTVQSPEIGLLGSALPADFRFNPDFRAQVAKYPGLFPQAISATLPSGSTIAAVDKDFKMPRVWRSNLAADIELPGNMILTVEALFTKDINAIVQKNMNLPDANNVLSGPDKRPRWSSGNRINSGVSAAMVLTNSSKGYQTLLTAQLTKNYSNGWSGMLAYTYNVSKNVSANPGSSALSAWTSNLDVYDLNNPQLSHSSFAVPHRVVGSLSYRVEYFRKLATTFSLYYNGAAQGRSTYAFNEDINGDGNRSDIMYIPANKYELTFVDVPGKMTAAEQAERFMKFIDDDKYLSSRKGQYAERFGAVNPWKNRWDAKIIQDLFTNFGSDRRYTLQLTMDIVNAGNLLSKDWGLYTRSGLANNWGVIMPLTYKGLNAGGAPTYTLNASDLANFDAKAQQINQLTTGSTWGMLFGVRLLF